MEIRLNSKLPLCCLSFPTACFLFPVQVIEFVECSGRNAIYRTTEFCSLLGIVMFSIDEGHIAFALARLLQHGILHFLLFTYLLC